MALLCMAVWFPWAGGARQGAGQSAGLEYLGEWGVHGQGPGELYQPIAIAADLHGRIYVADKGSGLLQKFAPSGTPLFSYQDPVMRAAPAIAVDSGGAIYLAQPAAGRIWIRWPEGQPLRSFPIAPQRGITGAFSFCITADGTVMVPDWAARRIQAFSPGGQLKAAWKIPAVAGGQPGQALYAGNSGYDDYVYVADGASGRIYKFTNRGAQQSVWEPPADAGGALRGIAVSPEHVFALRGAEARIEIFSPGGRRELAQPIAGLLDGGSMNLSLAVTPEEELFLLDAGKSRVLHFRMRAAKP